MEMTSLLVYTTHGTYGRDDDGYGALMAANTALAKGIAVTVLLLDDGVAMAKTGQDTSMIGLPNNLGDLQDFIDLDGRLVVVRESMEERGITEDEIMEGAEVVGLKDIPGIIEDNTVSITM